MSFSHEEAAEAARRRPRWSELCWIGVLAAIGVVQVIRGQWFDAVVYGLLVTVLTTDAVGLVPERTRTRAISLRVLLVAAVACGAALIALPRHSPVMMVALVLVGLGAVVVAWPGSRVPAAGRWPVGLRRLAWAWAGIVIAGCVWELGEFIAGILTSHQDSQAFSDLADPALSALWGKVIFVVVWVAAGVWLLRRGPGRGRSR
ncbi:hypothetical protein [Microbacterium candidum]|uniref:Uncharacterized protein n=1 Tax=Microbacterium candidum TaxID=3041922 RepID=A0ABT7MUC5_9MICO|nr:hypothetical protein [Microbacterium sp. ASV49]MDL9978053.1 hypothetical protein [Microbacterium sp. ASV49]